MKEKGRQDETQAGDQEHMTIPFQVVIWIGSCNRKVASVENCETPNEFYI